MTCDTEKILLCHFQLLLALYAKAVESYIKKKLFDNIYDAFHETDASSDHVYFQNQKLNESTVGPKVEQTLTNGIKDEHCEYSYNSGKVHEHLFSCINL